MSQYRHIRWSTAQQGECSHASRGAVTRVLVGLLALAALVTGVGLWTPSAQAQSFGWAYLWADQPTSPSYTPPLAYQFNSSAATNTVVRTGVGAYTAMLPYLGAIAGTVHVTAYGTGSEACKVASWSPGYPFVNTQWVNVRCFTSAGVPADARFTMTYAHPRSSPKPMAFLLADQPTSSSYTPPLAYQFNSSGATNTVVRTGVGAYTATLPFLAAYTGHVQVAAYGTGSERCKVVNWGPSGWFDQQVNVRCFTSAGAPVDTRFTMTYVSGISLVGDQYDAVEGLGTHIAYVRDDQPTSPSYTPSAYQFNDTGASNTITRSGVGVYSVQFPGLSLGYGDVQVTAYGSGSEYCKVAYWMPGAGVQVRCFSSAGAPVDAGFDVTFLSSIWPRT